MLVIIGPIMWVIHNLSYYYTYTNTVNNYGFFTMAYCIWYTYGALLQQVTRRLCLISLHVPICL